LTAIAPLLRVRPEIQEICRFAARWEAEHQAEPLGWAQFHIVTKGRCFLEQRYGEPLTSCRVAPARPASSPS
jgi:AraC family transcriptional regulator, activator of mtrCDE